MKPLKAVPEGYFPLSYFAEKYGYAENDGANKFIIRNKIPCIKWKKKLYAEEELFAEVFKKKNNLTLIERSDSLDTETKLVVQWLNKQPLTLGEISRRLDRSKETITKVLDKIHSEGIDVTYDTTSRQAAINKKPFKFKEPLLIEPFYKDKIKIGCISDTHLGSFHQQLTLLRTAYEIFDSEKVDFITHSGDLVEGYGMHSDQTFESFKHGFDDIRNYVVEVYPESKQGIKTWIIGGSHDMSYKKKTGANIVRAVCEKRPDLVYGGEESASFSMTGKEWFNVNLLHPAGGLAYSRSYKSQKQAESLVSSAYSQIRSFFLTSGTVPEKDSVKLPLILIVGHYHVSNYIPQYLGVDTIMMPCMQSQTSFLKRMSLFPQVGFLILTIEFDEERNVTKVIPDFRFLNAYVRERDF